MAYEYSILAADVPEVNVDQLNSYGARGWRLVQVYEWQAKWYYIFERVRVQ